MRDVVGRAAKAGTTVDVHNEVRQLLDEYPDTGVPFEALQAKLLRIGSVARVALLLGNNATSR
jgi:hypothetical protein